MKPHEHLLKEDRLAGQIEEFGPLPQGATSIPSVEHQDDCSFFDDQGCDCQPEIVFLDVPSQEIAAESSIVMIVSAQHSSSCRSRLGESYSCLLASCRSVVTARWRAEEPCSLVSLPSVFLEKAQELREEFGAEGQAKGVEWCLKHLERALQEQNNRLLNLQKAAELSGYTPDSLGRMVRGGKIPNAGRPGSPKIRLKDVPKKANGAASDVAEVASRCEITSATAIVRSVITEGG